MPVQSQEDAEDQAWCYQPDIVIHLVVKNYCSVASVNWRRDVKDGFVWRHIGVQNFILGGKQNSIPSLQSKHRVVGNILVISYINAVSLDTPQQQRACCLPAPFVIRLEKANESTSALKMCWNVSLCKKDHNSIAWNNFANVPILVIGKDRFVLDKSSDFTQAMELTTIGNNVFWCWF